MFSTDYFQHHCTSNIPSHRKEKRMSTLNRHWSLCSIHILQSQVWVSICCGRGVSVHNHPLHFSPLMGEKLPVELQIAENKLYILLFFKWVPLNIYQLAKIFILKMFNLLMPFNRFTSFSHSTAAQASQHFYFTKHSNKLKLTQSKRLC